MNNDGLSDLYVVKGNVWAMPDFAEDDPNNLLLGRADGTFMESGDKAGVASMAQGRGGALVDLNADGLLDMIAINRNEPSQIWRNTGAGLGNWIALDLALPGPNRNAIGAWIELRRPDGKVMQREVQVGGGHVGGILVPQHFGLGPASSAEIRILWPDGTTGPWQTLAANGTWRIEPGKDPVPLPAN